jgi:hypothetical protein
MTALPLADARISLVSPLVPEPQAAATASDSESV